MMTEKIKGLLPLRTENWKLGDTRDIRDENNNRISYDLPKDVAEFFVTACNNFDVLLKAIEDVRDWIGANSKQLTRNEIVAIMENAIALAKDPGGSKS